VDHGQQLVAVTGEGRIEGMHWGSLRPYVMFITGRCGSTWLAEMLAATGLAGNPTEWLNSEVASFSDALETGTLGGYFATVAFDSAAGDRFGMQIDPVRLRDTLPLVDWQALFPSDGTATFFLYRRDVVAQAWSWVHALKSDIWHAAEGHQAPRPEHAPTPRELIDQIVDLRGQEEYLFTFWAEHGYEPHFIEYESMAANPPATVAAILRDIEVPDFMIAPHAIEVETKSQRLTYGNSRDREMLGFANANRQALDALERDRFGVPSGALRDWLVEG
jgi:LPS sulfotransferase NodH